MLKVLLFASAVLFGESYEVVVAAYAIEQDYYARVIAKIRGQAEHGDADAQAIGRGIL